MAKTKAVWGIDIGQSALKAMRCLPGENGEVVATTYDYIEYPKVLSQADSDADELIKEALETLLERNELQGDYVAMSVSGQAGLSRFFRPPPVDAKTLPEIVKYEVKQQIPFPIEDVIWDWQSLGGTEMDDVIVDAEVGLFAIKRDTVFAALQPFTDANIEVDLVQLSPLSVYNVICHDVLDEIPDPDTIDPDNPPESLVVLSMGTDATDLIITNGVKLWLRNIPIGGNHFTKQLSRELKMTHAKAEHLKRNVRQMAENEEEARRVFQSMRPIFNDLVTEIQRSLTFFGGIEKNANIERVVLLGNAARLPGLRQYLTKQLELDIVKVNDFEHLTGDTTSEKSFQDNLLSFTPCYGLCLQGLKNAKINTNLLPHEFVKERLIRAKKPWVLASIAAILAGMTFGYLFSNIAWWKVQEDYISDGKSWDEAATQVSSTKNLSDTYVKKDKQQKDHLDGLNRIATELSDSTESKSGWAELLSAIYQFTPRDPRISDGMADPNEIPFDEREEILIQSVETQFFPEVSKWRAFTEDKYKSQFERATSVEEALKKVNSKAKTNDAEEDEFDLSGPGWIVELDAYHFHNNESQRMNSEHMMEFVRRTLLEKMQNGTVKLPGAKNDDGTYAIEEFKLSDIGIYYPTVVWDGGMSYPYRVENLAAKKLKLTQSSSGPKSGKKELAAPNQSGDGDAASDSLSDNSAENNSANNQNGSAASSDEDSSGSEDIPEVFELRRYDFKLQFAWIPTARADRILNREQRIKDEQKKQANKNNANKNGNKGQNGDANNQN